MNEVCKAERTLALGDHASVTIGCGITEDQHLNSHRAVQRVEDVRIVYFWDGHFVEKAPPQSAFEEGL